MQAYTVGAVSFAIQWQETTTARVRGTTLNSPMHELSNWSGLDFLDWQNQISRIRKKENYNSWVRMDNFSVFQDKKCLMFFALEYHNRILLPVKQALEQCGVDIVPFSTQAEAGFELNLIAEHIPFLHSSDFVDEALAQKINAAHQVISNEFLRLYLEPQSILQNVIIVIFGKIVRAQVEFFYAFEKMLDEIKPDFCVSLHLLNSWGKTMGYCCHRRGIPIFGFQEGLNYSAVPMYRFHNEYGSAIMLWGKADQDVLLAANNELELMPIVGNIDLANTIEKVNTPENIVAVKDAYGIPQNNDVLLILFSHASYGHLQDTGFIHWLWNHPHVTCVMKFHPIQAKALVENAMHTFGQIPNVKIIIVGDTYGLMATAKACILVGASTTGIEALTFNKPLVEIPLPDSTYSYHEKGAVPTASSLSEAAALTWKLAEEGQSSEWYDKREAYLRHHFHGWENGKFDGKTVERVLEVMAGVLGKGS